MLHRALFALPVLAIVAEAAAKDPAGEEFDDSYGRPDVWAMHAAGDIERALQRWVDFRSGGETAS